jgi:putative tryptophan/tyrosine transport system substrate-binding protein
MRRREFIGALGTTVIWPTVSIAQQFGPARRIAFMTSLPETDREGLRRLKVFEQTLEALGWIGPRRLQIDKRWDVTTVAKGQAAVTELLNLSPEVILAGVGQTLMAAKAATQTIPIVFVGVSEPVSQGFVESLAHPGGNITGFTNLEPQVGSKWLQLLKEIAPGVTRVAVVFNPETGAASLFARSVEASASTFGVEVLLFTVRDPAGIAPAIESVSRQPGGGLIIPPDGFLTAYRNLLVQLTSRYRLPAVYPSRVYTDAGGLASYGTDTAELFRQAARYVDRILRGEKPADLPVVQPTKFEFVINLNVARALGLVVPPTLLVAADEVIE